MSGPIVREILFPTDFSAVSETAGHMAAGLARHFGARLQVLHVVPPHFNREAPRPALQDAVAALEPGVSVTAVIEAGLAAPTIVAYAGTQRIDLIVIGTHGRTGLSHALLGSVAEAVVRRAPCPVLTVPATVPAAQPGPAPARCIVCAESSSDLVCARCRTWIRVEGLERKGNEERPARVAGHGDGR
jgi:universal stress protein A